MAEFEAKAKAIWAALDKMAEKSPDMYKQFINDQLNGDGAQDMLKQLNLGPDISANLSNSSSTNRKTPGSRAKKTEQEPMSSSSVSTVSSKKRSVLTTSSGRMPTKNTDNQIMTSNNPNSLLDDTFVQPNSNLLLNPFMAQIVANDEDDGDLLTELKLPEEVGNGDTSKTKKPHKPLIEEL